MTQIKVENATMGYEGVPVIKDLSFQINEGDYVCIVGENGSGKTTFARLLNGLVTEYYQGKLEGDIQVVGMQPGQNSVEKMSQKIASVFQNPAT